MDQVNLNRAPWTNSAILPLLKKADEILFGMVIPFRQSILGNAYLGSTFGAVVEVISENRVCTFTW